MDPICAEKIKSLQKYVPLLANILKHFTNGIEKADKLVQTQLLYDFLRKPHVSVNIEYLEKCEEVLSRIGFNPNVQKIEPEDAEHSSEDANQEESASNSMETGHGPADETNVVNGQYNLEEEMPSTSNMAHLSGGEKVDKTDTSTNVKEDAIVKLDHEIENVGEEDKEPAVGDKISENKAHLSGGEKVDKTDTSTNVKEDAIENLDNEIENVGEEDKEPAVGDKISENKNEEKEDEQEKVEPEVRETVKPEEEIPRDKVKNNENLQEEIPEKMVDDDENKKEVPTDLDTIDDEENTKPPDMKSTEEEEVTTEIETDHKNNEQEDREKHDNNIIIQLDSILNEPSDQNELKSEPVDQTKSARSNEKEKTLTQCNAATTSQLDCILPTTANSNDSLHDESLEESYTAEEKNSISSGSDCVILYDELENVDVDDENVCRSEPEDAINKNNETKQLTISNEPSSEMQHSPISEVAPRTIDEEIVPHKVTPKVTEAPMFKIVSTKSLATEIAETPNKSKSATSSKSRKDGIGSKNKQLQHTKLPAAQTSRSTRSSKRVPAVEVVKKTPEKKPDNSQDVLLIETRTSPICLDTDPEEENITTDALTTELPKPTSKENAEALEKIRHIMNQHGISVILNKTQSQNKGKSQNHSNRKSPPKKDTTPPEIETITVLDSSSDEESPQKRQQSKTNNKNKVENEDDDDDVIIVSAPESFTGKKSGPEKVSQSSAPTPAVAATAQSHFLNAVNLQPIPPPTISKNIATKANDRVLKAWLYEFLKNFASTYQIASHACFILLQRVLKYRYFQTLKETRLKLNAHAREAAGKVLDVHMLVELRNVFFKNGELTEAGRTFCQIATNDAFGKPVALMTEAKSNKVTCRTRVASVNDSSMKMNTEKTVSVSTKNQPVTPTPSTSSTCSTSCPIPTPSPNQFNFKRSRKYRKLSDGTIAIDCDDDDNDYTPSKGEVIPEEEAAAERKRSLRTNRTKRKEAGFTYSEDHDDEEFEALTRKMEEKQKRYLFLMEEKELEREKEKEREKEREKEKEKEREKNIKAKKIVVKKPPQKRPLSPTDPESPTDGQTPGRKKLRLADSEIFDKADDELLTPTWVEADDDEPGVIEQPDGSDTESNENVESASLIEFSDDAKSQEAQVPEKNIVANSEAGNVPESDDEIESIADTLDIGSNMNLKNTNRKLHAQSKFAEYCVHCSKRIPRIVHHYVNEHRKSEVFTARIRTRDVKRLLTTNNSGYTSIYKGNQQQYTAHCIFCNKEVKFLLSYWYQHFTIHTGEYTFKCSGCGVLKPTRSLLTHHLQSAAGCPKKGSLVKYQLFDTKSTLIEAYVCVICNYVQLHRKNVIRHLKSQHDVETISEKHIIKVTLLNFSPSDTNVKPADEFQLSLLQSSDEEEPDLPEGQQLVDEPLMVQNNVDFSDDLSFMICGMLDVQMTLPANSKVSSIGTNANQVDN